MVNFALRVNFASQVNFKTTKKLTSKADSPEGIDH